MKRKEIYNKFHKKTTLQKRILKHNNFTYRFIIKMINRYFDNVDSVLDLGCGVGTIDFFLANQKKNVHGIDISKKAIDTAIKNSRYLGVASKVSYELVDFPNQYVDGKYDGIIISEVLEHLPNDKKAVKQIKKNCKSGTIIIASSPSNIAPLFKLGLLKDFDKKVGHVRRYSEKDFINLFKNEGFKIIKLYKTEGIIRNLLYTNDILGKSIRFIKGPMSDLITTIDNISLKIFGESNYYLIAQKK